MYFDDLDDDYNTENDFFVSSVNPKLGSDYEENTRAFDKELFNLISRYKAYDDDQPNFDMTEEDENNYIYSSDVLNYYFTSNDDAEKFDSELRDLISFFTMESVW